MDLGLKGKVAFIAGSSRGIGRGIADAFLREGCFVAVTGRDSESLDDTVGKQRNGLDLMLGNDRVQPDVRGLGEIAEHGPQLDPHGIGLNRIHTA